MNNLDRIFEISVAKGFDKLDKLKQYSCIKHIFEYAYNPFKKYYITPPDMAGSIGGTNFTKETKQILDLLISRKLSGNQALEEICDHIVTLSPDSAEVFKRILAKDLRCGLNIKSINKVYPGLIPLVFDGSDKPPVMLLHSYNPKQLKYPCIVAVKKDGVRGLYTSGIVLSRQGHQLIGHDHIEKELQKYDQNFDGELCIPGLNFDEASGFIRDKKSTPYSVYHIFDVPTIPGNKQERYEWLANNLIETDNIKLIPHRKIELSSTLNWAYNSALNSGEEGLVIYDPNSMYEDKRSFDWMRLVPIKSADCQVIGFYEGRGKHANSLGGIIIDYKGHKVKVGTGFKEKILESQLNQLVSQIDKKILTLKSKKVTGYSIENLSPLWLKIRQFIWDNQDLFMGVIAKVEYKEKTKAGSLRQPRFKTWRWDK